MIQTINVPQLDEQKAEEIKSAISSLAASRGKAKHLALVLQDTKGDIKLAIDIAKSVHASNVNLMIEASGIIDPAGTILAAAGEKGNRHASFDTVFQPFESGKYKKNGDKRLSPKNQSVITSLSSFYANSRRLKGIALAADEISAFEAKSLKIIDKVDVLKSKYPRNNKKTKKSSRK